jgi:DNA-binding beta-propeller fold protein YncE
MRPLILQVSIVFWLAVTGCKSVAPEATETPTDAAPSAPPQTAGQLQLPGIQPDGSVRLPNQWMLRPAGKQVVVGDFPSNLALHPSGKFVAVLHCGNGPNEIVVLELPGGRLVSRAGVEEAFYGLAFSPDGSRVFCSGAGKEVVHAFDFKDGYLSGHDEIRIHDAKERGIPAGLACSRDGKKLFVASVWGHAVSIVDVAQKAVSTLPLGTNGPPSPARELPPSADEDDAAITKRAEALLDQTRPEDPFPYGCVLDEKRNRLYVSLWAQASVAVLDLVKHEIVARWKVEEHPNEMLLAKSGRRLFVANANRNTVTVLDPETGRTEETLVAELRPEAHPGSTPNGLALSPDEKLLFVANANINAVAVFDVAERGASRSLGFIPVGWYPTSVRVTPDGKRLVVANGKGLVSKSNRNGPQPGQSAPGTVREYIANLLDGTVSIIDLASGEKFIEQMRKHTAATYRCLPTPERQTLASGTLENPIPIRIGEPSPIQYCIYIIKENRTYDQVLGDMPEGNGDPALCLFPERVTPNHHALAREFVLLDNFYVDGEVSADGHEWTMGAYATDFVEKTWPLSYGHNKHKKFPYPAEGNFDIARPAGGYLWDRAREAGVSYRSYGEFVRNGKTTNDPGTARVSALKDHIDPWYRGFDMDYPDVARAARFISELKRFEREGEMPRLQVLRISNDHTSGTATNKIAPLSAVADNDQGLGLVIEAVSRSKFWPRTAIFVVEDDAQNGPDHVDAHRTIAFVVSPYTKRGAVDSTMYSTSSMLRTMELILGLRPMSQFDAAAMPMYHSFMSRRDLTPYRNRPPHVDLYERNKATAWGSERSRKMDFTKEDAADDLELNEVLWRSIRGADSPMPAPKRAAFVRSFTKDDDD